jgi:hypothetical protein
MTRRAPAFLVAVALVWGGASAATRLPDGAERAVDSMTAAELRGYVETLASDAFRGRGVGDEGNRAAEAFICRSLMDAGLTPGGEDGSCYDPVDVFRPTLDSTARLTVTADGGETLLDLAPGRDFYPLPETGDRVTSAALAAPGADVRGAIAVIQGEASPSAIAAVVARGARGVINVASYLPDVKSVWPEHPSLREADYRLVSSLRDQPAPVVTLSDHAAAPLLRALADGRRLRASITPGLVAAPVRIHNVLALVQGRDGRHRDELVIVGAHLDHDGIDDEGRIYNGADDNASGTAAVMGAAAALARAARAGEAPARTVLFALWNGEEKGELGAESFLADTARARRVVANLNLDMVGRHEEVPDPGDWRFSGFPKIDAASSANTLHVLGYSYAPGLAREVREANAAVGLTLKQDYDIGAQDLLHRSDQWPFLRRGIPAVFLTTGLHPDYHTPDDDVERIDFGKLEKVARLAARAAWIVATDKPPKMIKGHQ